MFKCPFALPDTAAKRRTSDEEIVSRPGYFPAVSDSLPPSSDALSPPLPPPSFSRRTAARWLVDPSTAET